MRRSHGSWSLLLICLLTVGVARAESPQEKKRKDILDDLGLQKKHPAPPPAGDVGPAPSEPAAESGEKAGARGGSPAKQKGAARSTAPGAPSFGRIIHPLLMTTCKPCHSPGAPAGSTRLLLSGDAAADHQVIVRFVNTRDPEASTLLGKVSGATIHGGGAPWPAAGTPYQRVFAWIRGGARLDSAVAAEPSATAVTPRATPKPSRRSTPPSASAEPGAPVPAPIAATPVPEAAVPAVPRASPAAPLPAAPVIAAPAAPSGPSFAATVHPVLMNACAICHRAGAPAAVTRLVLSGDPARDEPIVRQLVDAQAPEQSLLVGKGTGHMHGGGAVLSPGDPRLGAILAWVKGLAAAEAPVPASSSAPPAPPLAPVPTPAAVTPGHAGAPPGPGGHGGPGGAGLALPLGFMLNGRFSLDYERRQFSGDPFEAPSVNALRSYHHFLFLSRDAAGESCGLSVEVLTLQFWEGHCRVPRLPDPLRLVVAGGKIVVPFGADPLYHQNYGGLGGFDQPLLPVIWAVEGMAAHLLVERRAFVFTEDLYVVRGYALPHADSIINLQSGFSTDDATKLGWGNRLGAAWMFVSAWYSSYYNPLGFGRRLFMQAFDLTIWRPRGMPVLQHFSLGAGAAPRRRLGRRSGRRRRGPRLLRLRRLFAAALLPDRLAVRAVPHRAADDQQPPRRRHRRDTAHQCRRLDAQLRRRGALPGADRRALLLRQPRKGR